MGDIAENPSALNQAIVMSEPKPGQFNSAFKPLFILRSYVAEKSPEVLTRLILWNAKRYIESGVHYVEVSLGTGWFRQPYLAAVVEGIKEAEAKYSVIFRLLIAFNRTKISNIIHNCSYLLELASCGDRKLGHAEEPEHYASHLEDLFRVKTALNVNREARNLVVGLDIVGNEECRPYTPFLLPQFLAFASEMKAENPNFGFRLHLGEGISSNDEIGYVSLRLGEYYIGTLAKKHGFYVRSGHGIGLLGLNESAFNRWKKRYPIFRGVAAKRLQENLRIATIEINLTSNYYLMECLGNTGSKKRSIRDHAMGPLLREGFNVVLGTDDPGIFPGTSLRSEYEKAYNNELIPDTTTFLAVVEESVRASFSDLETRRSLSKIVTERYPQAMVPQDKRSVPVMEPLEKPSGDLEE
ncbi:MAG: hypothetical protein RTU09_11005, partial [Candidatus Thorarchaeota archaeon]